MQRGPMPVANRGLCSLFGLTVRNLLPRVTRCLGAWPSPRSLSVSQCVNVYFVATSNGGASGLGRTSYFWPRGHGQSRVVRCIATLSLRGGADGSSQKWGIMRQASFEMHLHRGPGTRSLVLVGCPPPTRITALGLTMRRSVSVPFQASHLG